MQVTFDPADFPENLLGNESSSSSATVEHAVEDVEALLSGRRASLVRPGPSSLTRPPSPAPQLRTQGRTRR